MNSDLLLIMFLFFGLLGVLLFFKKSTKNMAYIMFCVAFFCMGLAAFSNNEPSSFAAFLLSLLASRKVKTKFDRL